MAILTINNAVKHTLPTLPTQTYCYSGKWPCEDSVHNCPERCGYVRYRDEQGNIVDEFGFCTADTNIQIIASEIIEVRGLNIESCSGTFRSLSAGNMTCVNDQVHFIGNDITRTSKRKPTCFNRWMKMRFVNMLKILIFKLILL